MRAVLFVSTLLVFLTVYRQEAQPSEKTDTTMRFAQFTADVMSLKDRFGLNDPIRTSISPSHEFDISPIAGTKFHSAFRGVTTYRVYVREGFLHETSIMLLEHIARHEICHLLNGDLRRAYVSVPPWSFVQKMERNVERCIYKLVGDEAYRAYVAAYKKWGPQSFELQVARLQILQTMPGAQ